MNCAEIHPLLHAYVDGELDLVRNLDVEQHLKTCTGCAAKAKSLRSLRAALQKNDLAYRAPASLRQHVRQIAGGSREKSGANENNLLRLWQWIAAGATAVAVLAICLRPPGISSQDELMNEVVASHVRSLMADHLTDVVSSDQHTVKPWFDGKLDFAPDVKDFAGDGFALVGGRLDYLNGRTVAALVYRHNKHFINVFIWPAADTNTVTEENTHRQGYNIIARETGGFDYYLVSDMDENGLGQLANDLGK
jgi:anti-sigma factor RsiW